MAGTRADGRDDYSLRKLTVQTDYLKYPEGSVYIACGETRVICAATLDSKVPPFLKGSGSGWITAEYAMLPRSTESRNLRESVKGQLTGRTQEIQRLIGRSLRAVVDLDKLGERTLLVDCDVIQADGGTRTTSITGAFLAVALAVDRLFRRDELLDSPLRDFVAAVSVGVVGGRTLLDLAYSEDSAAEVDLNVVATGDGRFVEIQGTAEQEPFSDNQLFEMLEIARLGIQEILELQRRTLAGRVDLDRLFPSLAWLKQ
jgi:ribonuclease PH